VKNAGNVKDEEKKPKDVVTGQSSILSGGPGRIMGCAPSPDSSQMAAALLAIHRDGVSCRNGQDFVVPESQFLAVRFAYQHILDVLMV
jgi:hypothetical protein